MKKLVLSFLLLATIGASAQKVSNKYSLKQGQRIEAVTDVTTTTEMAMGESSTTLQTTELYAVKSVSGGSATLEKSITKMKINASGMGQKLEADSEKPEDLKGQSGEIIKGMMEDKQEFTINANGRVTAVVPQKKKEAAQGMMAMMLEQMKTSSVATVGANSALQVLPAYAVGVGDSWSDTTFDAKSKMVTTYTLKSITGADVLVDYASAGTIDTKQEMMGMSTDIKGKVAASGTITADAATGLPKRKTNNTTSELAMSLMGQDLNVTTKTATTTTFTVQ